MLGRHHDDRRALRLTTHDMHLANGEGRAGEALQPRTPVRGGLGREELLAVADTLLCRRSPSRESCHPSSA